MSESQNTNVDVATAVADVRASMAELDDAIAALRNEATRLRASADASMAVALLDRTDVETEVHSQLDIEAPHEVIDNVDDVERAAFDGLVEDLDTPDDTVDDADGTVDDDDDTVVAFRPRTDLDDIETTATTTEVAPAAETLEAVETAETVESGASPSDDGLDAIETAASTDMAASWAGGNQDNDDAFAKFFSSEVEPEPAQRWLLDDL